MSESLSQFFTLIYIQVIRLLRASLLSLFTILIEEEDPVSGICLQLYARPIRYHRFVPAIIASFRNRINNRYSSTAFEFNFIWKFLIQILPIHDKLYMQNLIMKIEL